MLIVPVSFCYALSIGACNVALMYANIGFVEMILSCGPVCTAVVCLILGLGFDTRLVLPVLLVTMGMALCATGEMMLSWIGFALAFVSTLARAFRSALTQQLLSGDAGLSLRPVEMLAWMSVPSTFWMLTWSVFTEGVEPYEPLVGVNARALSGAIAVTCINALCLNLSQVFVLKHLGAVGTVVTGNLKGVLILLGGIALFGEVIQLTQVLGYMIEVCGILWYSKIDEAIKAEKNDAAETEKVSLLKSSEPRTCLA